MSSIVWHVSRYPLAGLLGLARLREQLGEVERELVLLARANGIPWEDVAWSLGVSRQGAIQRYPGADDDAELLLADGRGSLAAALLVLGEDDDETD